jgi:hypothetical protein
MEEIALNILFFLFSREGDFDEQAMLADLSVEPM